MEGNFIQIALEKKQASLGYNKRPQTLPITVFDVFIREILILCGKFPKDQAPGIELFAQIGF